MNLSYQDAEQVQGTPIVYKLVSVIDGQRLSVTMAACSAMYRQNHVTYPPIPHSLLFAYRTLEDAQQEYDRLIEISAWRPPHLAIPPMEIWKAVTTREVQGPKRILCLGVFYIGLLRKCGYGATLADAYAYFWENTAHCLRYHITKACGCEPSSSTIFCTDLTLLEQIRYP